MINFDEFNKNYPITHKMECGDSSENLNDWDIPDDLKVYFSIYQGVTFDGGVYRVPCGAYFGQLMLYAGLIFPEFKTRILCFGYDWLGRIFALDRSRNMQVLLLDPGFAEVLEMPVSLEELHNVEFIEYKNDSLAYAFYLRWKQRSQASIMLNQCVGYRVSPMLGGEDNEANLEVTDAEVYWAFSAQIQSKVGKLPKGTVIGQVNISK